MVPIQNQRIKTVIVNPTNDASAFMFECYRAEQGRRLAVLRVDYSDTYAATTRYWVDLEHDSAIVKHTREFGVGGDALRCSIDYRLTAGVWLPNHWVTTYFGNRGRTNFVGSFTVWEVTPLISITSDQFVLKPSPGMHVRETRHSRDPRTKEMVLEESWYQLDAAGGKNEQLSTTNRLSIP